MNVALIDPFILAQDFPDALTGRMSHATCLRFNRLGDLLAAGRSDGTVVIYDIETNGVAQKLRGHVRQVQSLSWSHEGRYLLSSAQDCKSILWDLSSGARVRIAKFEAPVYTGELHPTNPFIFVAALLDDDPVVVDLTRSTPTTHQLPTCPSVFESGEEEALAKSTANTTKQLTLVTIFDSAGHHIITGTNKGWINVIDFSSREIIYSTRLCSSLILLLRLSASGRSLLCNASDKIIRTVNLPDLNTLLHSSAKDNLVLEVEHRFQDVVQKLSWNHASFSATGDYVAATTYMNRDIYLWERGHGSLIKILECPDEELGTIEWHPQRPLLTACGLESGIIYIWSIIAPQRWSALAPDFAEVEENVDYVEQEDEFDIHPIEEIHKRRLDREDEIVDVLTLDPGISLLDTSTSTFRMPVHLDLDNLVESDDEMIEVARGVMRRKLPGEGPKAKQDTQTPAMTNGSSLGPGERSQSMTNGTSNAKKDTKSKSRARQK